LDRHRRDLTNEEEIMAEDNGLDKGQAQQRKRTYGRGVFEKYEGVWYARWTDAAGHRHVQKAGPKSAALRLYRRRKDEVLQGKRFPENLRKGVKFAAIAEDAIERARRSSHAPGNLVTVKDWFAGADAADVTPLDVERELNRLRVRGLKPATRNRFKSAVSAIFTHAARDGKVLANPARLVKAEPENNARTRELSIEEERRLRPIIRERWPQREAEFDLALETGMRKGEQYGARWEQVNLIDKELTVPRSKHGERRYVRLNVWAVAALAALRRRVDASGCICPGGMSKNGYGATRHWFNRALAAAGIGNFTWHDLRHTFASRLRRKGVDIPTIMELMGHKSIATTLRYAHIGADQLQAAVERLTASPVETADERAPLENVLVQ
jgi:integrase